MCSIAGTVNNEGVRSCTRATNIDGSRGVFNDYSGVDITYVNLSPGLLTGALHTNASHSIFSEYSGTVNITYGNHSSETVAETLATLNPVDRGQYDVSRCMDETREYIFKEIDRWLYDVDEPNIFWLSGSPVLESLLSHLV
jgi:hypothetical protein